MKLVFFGTYLSSSAGSKGPGETIAADLKKKGYEVELMSRARHFFIRSGNSLMKASFGSFDIAFLDIYSSRVVYLSALLGMILGIRKIPYVAVLHGGGLPDRYEKLKKALTPLLNRADRVITPSKYLQNFFGSKGFVSGYIPNPLDTSHFSPATAENDQELSPVKILWVRAFAAIYEPEMPIRILHELHKKGIQATLSMVGPDKGNLEACKQLATELKLVKYIDFTGPVKNENLVHYYRSHSIFLNTTRYESFGLAVSEAAACGLPCVTNSVGELKENWIHGKEIILCDGTLEGYLAGISILIEDRVLYRLIKLNAREKALNFSLDRVTGLWDELLQKYGRDSRQFI